VNSDSPRYAIYFAPELGDPWWTFGTQWLGSNPITGQRLHRFSVEGLKEADCERITEAPRFYGLHATLKPPFALAEGWTEKGLIALAQDFCRTRIGFELKRFAVRTLGDFIALRPTESSAEIGTLAAECVKVFDPFRRPMDANELHRRASPDLDPRQLELLHAWGYPYVFDQFRFHLSLTGALEPEVRELVASALAARCSTFPDRPVPVTGICVFSQPTRTTPFRFRWRVRWGGAVEAMGEETS
jgi:putative phosphonate metabolism protein